MTLPKFDITVYLTFLFLPILFIFLFTAVYAILLCSVNRRKSWDKPVSAGWSGLVKLTFIGNFRREKIAGTKDKLYIFYDYFVSRRFVRNTGLLCLSLWQSLIVTFWITFLVKTSDSCEHAMDCFDENYNSIEDCNQFISSNGTVQCFQFELDFVNGAGTAGGLLAIAIAVIYGQLSMQMWLKKKIERSKTPKEKLRYKIISALSVILPLLVELIYLGLSIVILLNSAIMRHSISALPQYVLSVFYLIPLVQFTTLPLCKKNGLKSDDELQVEIVEEEIDQFSIEHGDSEDNEMGSYRFNTRFKRYTVAR